MSDIIKNLMAAAEEEAVGVTCDNDPASQSSDNTGVVALRRIPMPQLTPLQDRTYLPVQCIDNWASLSPERENFTTGKAAWRQNVAITAHCLLNSSQFQIVNPHD